MVYDQDILDIARTTIHSLKQIGIDECCFVGGMACNLYTHAYTFSEGREPNVRHSKKKHASIPGFILTV